jgi:hypothetical protein
LIQFLANRHDEPAAVGSGETRVTVGKPATDVPETTGSQQCVGHRVQQHIRVTVADRPTVCRYLDPSNPQRPIRLQPMGIVPDPDPHR